MAIACNNLPTPERFLIKDLAQTQAAELDFNSHDAELEQMDDEFWQAYHALDRGRLFEETLAHLQTTGQPVSLHALAQALPPTHDLETLAYWLAIAREAGVPVGNSTEAIDLFDESDGWTRFHAPKVSFSFTDVVSLEAGELD